MALLSRHIVGTPQIGVSPQCGDTPHNVGTLPTMWGHPPTPIGVSQGCPQGLESEENFYTFNGLFRYILLWRHPPKVH